MKKTHSSRTSIVLSVALFAALAVVVVLLFLFKERIRVATAQIPEQIRSGLSADMLGLADEIPRFDQIEQFVIRAKEQFPIEQIYITKFRLDNLERCIYPWYEQGTPGGSISYKIEQGGVVLGYLYLSLNTGRERSLETLINILIPLLILAAFALAFHVWRREAVLAATQVQLDEKNRELAHLERLSLAGQLAANLLHDLKKPILHIRDELRQKEDRLDRQALTEQADLFFQMLRETSLEKLAAASDEKQEYLDVAEVLQTAINLVKYERNHVELTVDLPQDLPLIPGYKYQLVQVFSNLLLNAYQALDGRGNVEVRATAEPDGRFIRITIQDNGPGISPEHLPHVLEPFYSASGRSESSGLGLYISSTIIKAMGGKFEIESSLGVGTKVTLKLPTSTP